MYIYEIAERKIMEEDTAVTHGLYEFQDAET